MADAPDHRHAVMPRHADGILHRNSGAEKRDPIPDRTV
jgi:hypothetical protein